MFTFTCYEYCLLKSEVKLQTPVNSLRGWSPAESELEKRSGEGYPGDDYDPRKTDKEQSNTISLSCEGERCRGMTKEEMGNGKWHLGQLAGCSSWCSCRGVSSFEFCNFYEDKYNRNVSLVDQIMVAIRIGFFRALSTSSSWLHGVAQQYAHYSRDSARATK